MGPKPMHDVVESAVMAAVAAATITFSRTSTQRGNDVLVDMVFSV